MQILLEKETETRRTDKGEAERERTAASCVLEREKMEERENWSVIRFCGV